MVLDLKDIFFSLPLAEGGESIYLCFWKDRPRRRLQNVAYLDQVALRIEKLFNRTWCSIIADLLPFSQKCLKTILSQYIDDLLLAPEIEIDYLKKATEGLLPELQTSGYRESLRKSSSVHPKLPISTISWEEAKGACLRVGLLPSLRSQPQRPRVEFRRSQGIWVALPRENGHFGNSEGPAQRGTLSP